MTEEGLNNVMKLAEERGEKEAVVHTGELTGLQYWRPEGTTIGQLVEALQRAVNPNAPVIFYVEGKCHELRGIAVPLMPGLSACLQSEEPKELLR